MLHRQRPPLAERQALQLRHTLDRDLCRTGATFQKRPDLGPHSGGRRIVRLYIWQFLPLRWYAAVLGLCADFLHLCPRERLPPERKERPEQQLLLLHTA